MKNLKNSENFKILTIYQFFLSQSQKSLNFRHLHLFDQCVFAPYLILKKKLMILMLWPHFRIRIWR